MELSPDYLQQIMMVLVEAGVASFQCPTFSVTFPAPAPLEPPVATPAQSEQPRPTATASLDAIQRKAAESPYAKLFGGNLPTLFRDEAAQ